MADADLDAVRRAFADLTGLCEDAALIVSEEQGAETIDGARLRWSRRLVILERCLQ
jgi:hypothetical protein